MSVDWTALAMLGAGFASGVFFAPLFNPRMRRTDTDQETAS